MPGQVKPIRKINLSQEKVGMIDIHVFGDASLFQTCAVAYVVIHVVTYAVIQSEIKAATWNQTRINCKQIKIAKEAINNTKTRISSSSNGSKFRRQHSKLFVKWSY